MKPQFLQLKKEYEELIKKLAELPHHPPGAAELGKKQAELLPMAEKIEKLEKLEAEIAEQEKIIAEGSELAELAKNELPDLKRQAEELEEALTIALLPKDPYDKKN